MRHIAAEISATVDIVIAIPKDLKPGEVPEVISNTIEGIAGAWMPVGKCKDGHHAMKFANGVMACLEFVERDGKNFAIVTMYSVPPKGSQLMDMLHQSASAPTSKETLH